jgi:hypothetical protein
VDRTEDNSGLSATSGMRIHFSPTLLRLCLWAFVGLYCVWNFLKPHKPYRNADVTSEDALQFLQEIFERTIL